MNMRLYLVRHPAPLVDAGICYGRSDVAAEALTPAALAQLRASLPADAPLYSSPLRRCAELAHALDLGTPIIDARLAELDFGDWEMRRWDDIARSEIDAWAADIAGYRPGGGECVADMARRVAAFCDDLTGAHTHATMHTHTSAHAAAHAQATVHARAYEPQRTAIVVCHAGTMRLLAACRHGLSPAAMARAAAANAHAIGYGALLTLDFSTTGLNAAAHITV